MLEEDDDDDYDNDNDDDDDDDDDDDHDHDDDCDDCSSNGDYEKQILRTMITLRPSLLLGRQRQ